ncbi:MAG: sigma-70 family RNA polymerase sigma factor [Clostridia bacterium]|nr:sigma-70 family RNA polymerase sigma factor [Clostridia bacterium]
MDDSEIISLFEARDEDAIPALDAAYSAYLGKIAMNVLGNREDAEECVNETFYRAWIRIPPARPDNLKAYLGKITRELAIDAFRARKSRRNTAGEYEKAVEELGIFSISDDATERTVEGVVLRDIIASFLKAVPERERNVFIRRYFFFDSVGDIGKMYGIVEPTVKVILFRMRNKLKKKLEKEGYEI